MKKLFALMLAVVIAFSMVSLAGCKEGNSSSNPVTTTTTTTPDTTATETTTVTAVGTSVTEATTITEPLTEAPTAEPVVNEPTSYRHTILVTTPAPTEVTWQPAVAANVKTVGSTMVSPLTKKTYELKFVDDFNGTALDSKTWAFQSANANGSEQQKNVKENIVVKDGILNMYLKKEATEQTVVIGKDKDGNDITRKTFLTGATINTNGKVAYKYGRIESRIRAPFGPGTWPAFWTVGSVSQGWPFAGEIDIWEFYGGGTNGSKDNMYNAGLHWCKPDETNPYVDFPTGGHRSTGGMLSAPEGSGKRLADDFHVFGIEWDNFKMTFYMDGNALNTIRIDDATMKLAFHNPHYLIYDFAVVSGNDWKSNVYPQVMQIDWVKVWQVKK